VAEHDAGADVAVVAAEWAGTATAPGSPVAVLQHPTGAGPEGEVGAGAGAGAGGLGLFERFDAMVGLQCGECDGAGEPGGAAAGGCSCCSLDPALDIPCGGAFAGGGMAAGVSAKRTWASADAAVSSQAASSGGAGEVAGETNVGEVSQTWSTPGFHPKSIFFPRFALPA
jgi:hypothetical protein